MVTVSGTTYLVKKARQGWYTLVPNGRHGTFEAAFDRCRGHYGMYQIARVLEDGTADPDYKPVEVRCRWNPTVKAVETFVLYDPNKPVDQAKLDRLFDADYDAEVA